MKATDIENGAIVKYEMNHNVAGAEWVEELEAIVIDNNNSLNNDAVLVEDIETGEENYIYVSKIIN